jgi:hypothetical protein
MTPDLIAAAEHLARVLETENAALAKFDLQRAAGLLFDKAAALDAFVAARTEARRGAAVPLTEVQRRSAEALTERLQKAAEDNRTMLERAMFVQSRVIGIFSRAMPRALAAQAARYGANGRWAGPASTPALSLRSRV